MEAVAGLIFIIIFLVIYFIPVIKILNKAGYSGWWSLLMLVPLVNFVMLYVFAFADWPALRGHDHMHPPGNMPPPGNMQYR